MRTTRSTRMFRLVFFLVALGFVEAVDKACPYKPTDIIFLIDGSGSEGTVNFKKQLQFVQNFTSQFEIGPNNTQVSLVAFATFAHNEFFLDKYYNKTELLERIGQTHYPDGETNTHQGLNYIRSNTLSGHHGGGRNVSKLVIVLTDGRSTEPEQLSGAALALKRNPLVTVVAVGIGHNVDPKELDMIATDSNHTFQVSSFDALHTIETELTDKTCDACKNLYTDICFVLDSSGSEGNTNFHKQLEFVNMVVNEFRIDGDGHVRVCVATFDTSARVELRLSAHNTKDALMHNILQIPYRDGETMTNQGIDRATHELRHDRDPSKIMILLTDGRSTEPELTLSSATHAHRNGIETYVIGIGRSVDNNELLQIASDKGHVFRVNHFDELDSIHQQVVDQICSSAKQYVETTTTTTTSTTTTLPPTTTKAACGLKPADIVFVLDSSDSEGADNFRKEVDFAHSFASQFSIGVNNVQFSVVTFSSDVRNDFFFNKYNSRNDVLHAIRNITYMGQGTNTSGALNFVRTESLEPANGARTNSSKFVIVITDGRSDLPDETQKEASLLHSKAEVISIGIGPKVDRGELSAIASNHRVVQVDSFALLNTIKTQLTDLACETGSN